MTSSSAVQRVAIIGAGTSGLPAIKHCLEEGMQPVCFEQRSDIGGMWNYTETVKDGWSSVMKSTVTNICKELYCFSDFPVPDKFPVYLPNEKVVEYAKLYAKQFDLIRYIRFNSKVIEVIQARDFDITGRWNITIEDTERGERNTETFDAVCLCAGHQCIPFTPKYEGQSLFRGKQLHAHEYRDWRGFEGKRVVVVGVGNSGGDIACELSRVCSQVYLSSRHGTWVIGNIAASGKPRDLVSQSRFIKTIFTLLPKALVNYLLVMRVNARFDHELYGIEPKHEFSHKSVLVNDELPEILLSGKILLKEEIKHLKDNTVTFTDGTFEENIDAIIYATGYKFGFRFVKHPAFELMPSSSKLYKYTFPLDLAHSTIAAVGYIRLNGSLLAAAEMQGRWAMKVFKNIVILPPRDVMCQSVKQNSSKDTNISSESCHHKSQINWLILMDEIAEEIGCKPNIAKLLLSDPVLGLSVYFGPITPAQYRLTGPGPWDGARQNILTVWDRIAAPMKTRKVIRGNWRTIHLIVRLSVAVLILCVIFAIYLF